jgi:hypothetical protein
MGLMLSRSLLAILLTLTFASSANAAVADRILPFYDAADGVRVVRSSTGEALIRFDRKAAKIFKTVAGKRAEVGCGTVTPQPLGDGPLATTGFMTNPGVKLPKKRGTVRMWTGGEICAISTKKVKDDNRCFPPDRSSKLCVRVAVAATPSGVAYLDARARSIELALTSLSLELALDPSWKVPGKTTLERMRALLGPDVAELATPDGTPPAGTVGYWTDGGKNFTVATLLADGSRRFVRIQDSVYSTNDVSLQGLSNDDLFTLT